MSKNPPRLCLLFAHVSIGSLEAKRTLLYRLKGRIRRDRGRGFFCALCGFHFVRRVIVSNSRSHREPVEQWQGLQNGHAGGVEDFNGDERGGDSLSVRAPCPG